MTDAAAGSLAELLARRAAAEPGAAALAVADGPELTWGDWERRSDAIACGLRERGVGPGDRVVLVFDVGAWLQQAVAYLGVMKAGGTAVPLAAPVTDMAVAGTVAHCRASAVVSSTSLAAPAAPVWTARPEQLEHAGRPVPPARPGPDDVAEIRYGRQPLSPPTGTARSHASVLADLAAVASPAAPADGQLRTLLHASPIGSELAGVALGLALRGDVSPTEVASRFEPDRFCALIAEHAIDACALTMPMARLILDSGADERHDLSSLRRLLLAVSSPPGDLLARLAVSMPTARLVAIHRPRADGPLAVFAHDRNRPFALGRRVAVVADPTDGGTVTGASTALAGDIDTPGTPWPGSSYSFDDDAVHLVGPTDRLISWRGRHVLAAEIEDALAVRPDVKDVSVLGVPNDDRADRLVAAVVLDTGTIGAAGELVGVVGERLGGNEAPTDVVVLDQLPRNRHGVLLRRRLRERLGLTAPPSPSPGPADPVEEVVAATWEQVLGRPPGRVDDDFFEFGGDEVAATRMLALVEDAFGAAVTLGAFLAAPTVAGLASLVGASSPDGSERSGAVAPLAFSQEGMIWHEQFVPGCQNLPALARRYRGALDVDALERAIGEIVRRHEPLRTTFEIRDGRALQVVRPPVPFRLPRRDLSALAPSAQDGEVERMLAAEGSRPFNLATDPLFAPTLVRLGGDDHVLVIRVHHSVFDDWSVAVFRRELSALYTAFVAGRASPLPEPTTRFSDFAREQRRRLAGTAGAAELSYWRSELAGAPFTTQLPVHDPSLPGGSPQTAPDPVSVVVPPELHRRLRELARQERTTLFMVMLAAFQVLVHRSTGQDDLLVASVVANRNRTELERLIGCFTKKVPLRLRLAPDATFGDVIAGARRALLGALAHQDLPFEKVLQEVLGADATAHGLTPHVAVMFQGVTPRSDELVLPGLVTTGFETSATSRRAHFIAAPDEPAEEQAAPVNGAPPWGGGLYLGTFVILSVIDTADELVCQARGAFHPRAVERLLASFRSLLGDLVASPEAPLAKLVPMDHAGDGGGEAQPAGPGATGDGTGRRSVELGGFHVDLGRIEAALSRCSGVRDVAVVDRGTDGARAVLVAYVVAAGPSPPTLGQLRTHLWSEMPGYAWPAAMVLVGSLPRLHSGAVDLDALPPMPASAGDEASAGPPVTGELALAAGWADVLGVRTVGVDENYWQQFSFLELLSPEGAAGPSAGHHVTRNRTIRTLATALAAERLHEATTAEPHQRPPTPGGPR